MTPSQGDIVVFRFGESVPDHHLHANSLHGQTRTVPAMVVEVFPQPDGAPALVNLQVFIDGMAAGTGGTRWETSVLHASEADGADCWDWRNVL